MKIEIEVPRNDCNASGGYSPDIKGERHETSDYEKGLNEAWEIARKIVSTVADGGYPVAQIEEIFHTTDYGGIFNKYSAQKVVDKIKAWEKKQEDAEIKVGDEVKIDGDKGIVIALQPRPYVLSEDGTGFLWLSDNDGLADNKTGRHFDEILKVLKQIQED